MTYTIRSTMRDISQIAPKGLSLEDAQKAARYQIKADAMSYGMDIKRDAHSIGVLDDQGEAIAYRLIKNADFCAGHRPAQEMGQVNIVAE